MCFDVWAPHAREVYVFGEFNDWNETSHEMKRVEPETMGVYELFVPGAQKGQMYKFIIVTEQGDKLYKADPYANSQSFVREQRQSSQISSTSHGLTRVDG